jgi:hypothetical protein
MTALGPYGYASEMYTAVGWLGTIPVGDGPRQKWPPPSGMTGAKGRWPSQADHALWRQNRADRNIALRLERGYLGIDVDAYDDKPGAATLAAVEAVHGPLPPTWVSSSRQAPSGIRVYRVPADATFPGELKDPVTGSSGIELVQMHHRYVVAWPSRHPETGERYQWRDPDGTVSDRVPSPDELPMLPAGWVEHLAGSCACYAGTLFRVSSGDPVADKRAEALTALESGNSRHGGVLGPVMALVGFRNRGAPGAADALAEVREAFMAAVMRPGTHQRNAREAADEWDRTTTKGKAASAGSGKPAWDDGASTAPDPAPPEPDAWPDPPDDAAFHGVLGAVARAVEPYTEADPVGILGTLLVMVGAVAGNRRRFYQGSMQHPNLSLVLVGETSNGRKGTAHGVAHDVMRLAVPDIDSIWLPGLASGEGLLGHLRRNAPETRALIVEPEYGRLLAVMNREGSTLSAMLRNAWDGVPLGHARIRDGDVITDHHVSLIGHVTPPELRAKLTDADAANGFANRVLFLAVRRTRLVPFPTSPVELVQPYVPDLHAAVEHAATPLEMGWQPEGREAWEWFYASQSVGARSGLVGRLTARHEAQVARLALIYALTDRADAVGPEHLTAAIALADYAKRSAVWAFGDSTGNRHADVLLRLMHADGEVAWKDAKLSLGLRTAADMDEVVTVLLEAGLAEVVTLPAQGRPRRVIRPKGAKGAKGAGPAHTEST